MMYDSKSRSTDGQIYDSRKEASGHMSSKREWSANSHDETSNHRKYMRVTSSSGNRLGTDSSSSQDQHQNGEKKSSKNTKKPLRIFGDWSEFRSSTGKTYFYNSKSEVSQWERPKGWPKDDNDSHRSSNNTSTSSSTDRVKKDSVKHVSSTSQSREKIEKSSPGEKSFHPKVISENNHHHNGTTNHSKHHSTIPSNEQTLQRLSSPGDDNSRMSFSSTSSKESSSINANPIHPNETNESRRHSSSSEPVATPVSDPSTKTPEISTNGYGAKHSLQRQTSTHAEPTPNIKVGRDQELQKFYRAELIAHLTGWPSTQSEKQCLKLFDEYYNYSAKISPVFTDLKTLKSNFRVLEMKRKVLTEKRLRCHQNGQQREDEKL